jgi:hypothetical protein
MEVLALAGLLGVGWAITRGKKNEEEGFADELTPTSDNGLPNVSLTPPPLYMDPRTPPGAPTVPGKPRTPVYTATGEYDMQFQLPSGGSLPMEPYKQQDLYHRSIAYTTVGPTPKPLDSVTAQVRMNPEGVEAPATYNSGRTIISPLTGLPMPASEFTHNNEVPFFRGEPKQNMRDDANIQRLDVMTGSGSTYIGKREQAPLFEPHREPSGNVFGLESFTDMAQDRQMMNISMNRANERPVEPVHVGPGLGQGYSSIPMGGFQQFESQEIAKERLSIDEYRYASNPKITYEQPLIAGKAINDMPALIGEVRHYAPDKFYLNEGGERNFVTAGENTKATERAAQVVKFQSREETTTPYTGGAGAADFEATYTVPSFRAPLATQLDGPGFRNADGSVYGVQDTDAENNDFGRHGVALPVNQRNVTGERTQGLNVTIANGPKAMTVYDPNDVARTTVRETTGALDYVGVAGPGQQATKLTAYDPTDIPRVTTRNTMSEPDYKLNVSRAGMPGAMQLGVVDVVRLTSKQNISAKSEYSGVGGPATEVKPMDYTAGYNMRTNPTKEVLAAGRRPIAGNGQLVNGVFSGTTNFGAQTYRKLEVDQVNDRDTTVERVVGPSAGVEALGIQRPKNALKLDISRERNVHEILDTLNDNPYALPIYKIAGGLQGPAAIAAAAATGYVSKY